MTALANSLENIPLYYYSTLNMGTLCDVLVNIFGTTASALHSLLSIVFIVAVGLLLHCPCNALFYLCI